MSQWRVVYEWTRAVFAVLGAIGGMIVLVLLLALFRTRSTNTEEWNEFDGATVKVDPLELAASLLNEAGIDKEHQALRLVARFPAAGYPDALEVWCIQAPGLSTGARWLGTQDLAPEFALAAKQTLDAAHAAKGCFPDWRATVERSVAIQPIQFAFSQRQLGYARLALYERDTGMLYLVQRSTPTSPPPEAPAPPAPSTE